jgi:hypothetical protein
MNRRAFLKGGFLITSIKIPIVEKPGPWKPMICESGSDEYSCIKNAQAEANRCNIEVRFTFNYHRHYCVFPDCTWTKTDDSLA